MGDAQRDPFPSGDDRYWWRRIHRVTVFVGSTQLKLNTACTVTKTAVTPTAYTRNSTAGCGLGEVLVETVDKNNNRTTKCYDSLCASSGTEPLNGLICASAATIYCAKVVGN